MRFTMLDPAKLIELKRKIAENPGVVIEFAAKEHGVTPRTILEALPDEMRAFAPGDKFIEVMDDLSTWGDVMTIINTEDGIFEIGGPMPKGTPGHGYFNLAGAAPLHGHLKHSRCAAVAFVERTFNNKKSVFIAFVNVDGDIMFKVFVGRDDKRELKEDQLVKFRALLDKLCGAA
jgi:putative heme utilization carrier protein HutX